MKKKVSLKDVAEHLGVSTALVSYVMNNKEKKARVSAEMADKVRKAAALLNYQPNLIAKSLKSGKTNTIGLIVADISNPFFSGIARVIEDEAKKAGYVVLFGSSDESEEKSQNLIDVFLNRQVDALIITAAENTEQQIRDLTRKNIPVVMVDRYFAGLDTDSVHIDNYQAAYKAVEQLIHNGRRRIAMMSYDTTLQHMQDRRNGYKDALRDNGIRFNSNWLKKASYKNIPEEVSREIDELISPDLKVDGFFFATNSLAVESLKRINEFDIKVPDDLAIISFDEREAFDFFYSPITYVNQSVASIGKEAVKLAISRINDYSKKPSEVVVQARLVIRESCGRKLKSKLIK
jgi:LacI family transcriptional regulator